MRKLIINVLTLCDQEKISSVAIPSLGTGLGGCSIKDVNSGFFDGFIEYLQKHPETSVKQIGLIIYDKKDLEKYITESLLINFSPYSAY